MAVASRSEPGESFTSGSSWNTVRLKCAWRWPVRSRRARRMGSRQVEPGPRHCFSTRSNVSRLPATKRASSTASRNSGLSVSHLLQVGQLPHLMAHLEAQVPQRMQHRPQEALFRGILSARRTRPSGRCRSAGRAAGGRSPRWRAAPPGCRSPGARRRRCPRRSRRPRRSSGRAPPGRPARVRSRRPPPRGLRRAGTSACQAAWGVRWARPGRPRAPPRRRPMAQAPSTRC